jgi:hypothetical protein
VRCYHGVAIMNPAKTRSRHGLNAAMTRVKLRGFRAIDRRTVAAREALAFRSELVAALGGEADLSPQRRRLVDMTARAALLLDHVDGWLVGQRSLVNPRAKALLPVLVQRQALADHLARLLEKVGLERVPRRIPTLDEYVTVRYAASGDPQGIETGAGAGAGAPEPSPQDRGER